MSTKKTTDFYFASAILSIGGKLVSTNKEDPRHMIFEISLNGEETKFDSKILDNALHGSVMLPYSAPVRDLDYYEREWANGTFIGNLVNFKDAIQRMKSVIHSK